MHKTKAVLFNGPPRSGKDTAADWIKECLMMRLQQINYMPFNQKMAETLKLAAHALFGEPSLAADAFEDCKDEPHPIFHGKTPRQVYIWLSEEFAKPRFGNDFFGSVYCHRIQQIIQKELHNTSYDAMIVCSDLGFRDEAKKLAEMIGPENMLIVHIHRKDCDFSNDSRSYIKLDGVAMFSLTNSDIAAFRLELFSKVRGWMDNGFVHRITV